jgi:type III secretion protein C
VQALRTVASKLDPTQTGNRQVIETLQQVQWIQENNFLLFVGSPATLQRVEALLAQYDIATAATSPATPRAAETFVIYTPLHVSGPDLISVLHEFMVNLQQSGVQDTALFDTTQNLKWVETTSSLIISGTPASIAQTQQLIARFDIPVKGEPSQNAIESIDNSSFLVYKLQYHPGNDIQVALKEVATSMQGSKSPSHDLIEAINSLQWVQITNSLLCSGQQNILERLRELIQNLDTPLRQVFIEVLIINTTLTNQQTFGLTWGGQLKFLDRTFLSTGNFPVPGTSQLPTSSLASSLQGLNATTFPTNNSLPFTTGFDLGVIGDIIMHKGGSFLSLGSLLNAIQYDADTTVVLNPKIIAQDNRQAMIFVGQNVPYTGSIVNTTGNAATQNISNIEYRDIGVSLTITPMLGEGDVVTLDIVQDISQLSNGTNVNTSTTSVTGIQTSHTHMETRVHVPDNHFVALSGMISDDKQHYRSAIPCLGGLPVIGPLFSENDRGNVKDNIIIFIRPQILKTYQEFKEMTEHQEWAYKDAASIPSLKEEFDDGVGLVKLPENE